jgi:hypothetical protein
MRAWWDRGIWRVVRGSGLTGAAASSLRTGAGGGIESTRGFRAGCSADGAGSETDGSTGCCFGVKSASAAWRALVIRSRSSPRGWGCCCRRLSKSPPTVCLIEVEFVNFGKSLPHLIGAVPRQSRITSDSGKSAARTILGNHPRASSCSLMARIRSASGNFGSFCNSFRGFCKANIRFVCSGMIFFLSSSSSKD